MNRLTVLLAGLALSPVAEAFTTRVHIALANDVREDLIRSPDGRTVRLDGTDRVVRLSEDDARAIREWPLAFRAGAVGPDNFVFPAMTDLTHAVGLRPYDQCEDLYLLAETDEERAYAMGCFLHGSSDAVAHHYVNWLTGETFTLTPITADRQDAWSNVVRHMVSESMIQQAWLESDPEAFEAAAMLHAIPEDFVLRTVMNPDSPVWQRMATHAQPQWEAICAADPDANLFDKVSGLEAAPAEYLVLLPLILDEAHIELDLVIPAMEARVADMQDWSSPDGSQLLVLPGPDGVLGTEDDDTDCTVTCPTLYTTYVSLVALLEPQPGGNPSAAEQLIGELHIDLDGLLPAYVETVAQTSALLNSPMAQGESSFDLANLDVRAVLGPMDAWVSDLTDIDWDLLARTVLPGWVVDLESFLNNIGIPLDLGGILQTLLQPQIDQVTDAITGIVMAELEATLGALTDEYQATEGPIENEFRSRLAAVSPDGVDGTVLDHWKSSGAYIHSKNIVAATLADHRMMLPFGDDHAGHGPASFDASYTLAWSQPANCDHLQPYVFPAGAGLQGLLAIEQDGTIHPGAIEGDSPVECHDGSLSGFSDSPTPEACALTDLDALLGDPVGSLSRAYPPEVIGGVDCQDITIEGLPSPSVDGPGDSGDPADDDDLVEEPGCGCATGGLPSTAWWLAALLVISACRRDPKGPTTGTDDPTTPTDTATSSTTTGSTSGTWSAGSDWELVQAIGDSVWTSRVDRGDGERVYELHFDSEARLVAEVRNPWGPGRVRTLRGFTPSADGTELHTLVQTPAGWPTSPYEGDSDTWGVELIDGDPRELRLTLGGRIEVYTEGATPVPAIGLTAIARSFEADNDVDDAFCQSGAGGFDYDTLFDFARGGEWTDLVEEEVVAGAHLDGWFPVGGAFGVPDLPDFDRDGGTDMTTPRNWVVRYVGTLSHPGGDIEIRERDDSVEDGLWVWLGTGVGGMTNDWFLEVHGFLWPDGTPNEPRANYPAGNLPIEVILVRCDVPIEDVELQVAVNGGPWMSAGLAPSTPDIDAGWFPATF